jgi:DNA-binding NtrC family response regulator
MDERDDFDLKEIGRRAGEKAEKEWIQQVLFGTGWNRKRTARLLQISYKTLLSKIIKYRLNSISPIFMSKFPDTHASLNNERKEI